VMQTSTVSEFNAAFSQLQRTVEVVEPMMSGNLKPTYPSIESMLKSAETLYLEMGTTNTWTGIKTKANQSGFVANHEGPKKTFCWNCGQEGHTLKSCSQCQVSYQTKRLVGTLSVENSVDVGTKEVYQLSTYIHKYKKRTSTQVLCRRTTS
jgi:Zinc knuckle